MCKAGGGANRCLPHNPVSKFVVKVVTTKTKANPDMVESTLSELNKEGKNLPSPSPETVKTWVETEKFSTQYDPELSEHDRKIQLNRLERADTENVSGGHFHAWKNLHNSVRSRMAQKVAATGLLIGMSASLVGCFATGGDGDPNSNGTPPPSPSSSSSAPISAGAGIGTGEKIATPDGGTYETVTVNPEAEIYNFNNGNGLPPELAAAGYTEEDGDASQRFVANYLVEEFMDSKALETGDDGYRQWYAETAPSYFGDNILGDPAIVNPSNTGIVMGNFEGKTVIPNLIHDGTPREKSLQLNLQSVTAYDTPIGTTFKYDISYEADYRVDDASAANFAATLTNVTPQEFLNSPHATDKVKDGTGENVFKIYGNASIAVIKDSNNNWKIVGYNTQTDFDSTDFASGY